MTYEYACEACGHQWEAQQSIKDPPLKACVSCGAKKAKRLVSGGTGFLLKGGGWYADGYGSKAASSSAGSSDASAAKSSTADAGAAADSGTGGDTKAKKEAAPAAESASKADTAAKPAAPATNAKAS